MESSLRSSLRPFFPLAGAAFLLMVQYAIVRPISRSLFLQHFAPEDMFWAMAAIPVLVTALMWPYGRLLSRLGPLYTVFISTVVSLVPLLIPFISTVGGEVGEPGPAGLLDKGAVFFLYVWKDAYIVLLVEQVWAFANSTFSMRFGKRLYGPFLVIGGVGSVAGSQLVALLSVPLGSWSVLALGVLLLPPFALLMVLAHRFAGGSEVKPAAVAPQRGGHSGLKTLFGSSYLLSLGGIVGLGQVMVAVLEVVFSHYVALEFATLGTDEISRFEGQFWTLVNIGSIVLQLLAPLLFLVVRVRVAHLLFPATHLLVVGALLVQPSLLLAAVAFAWFKVVDYSLFRASKELLYVPLGFDERYRAKMLIDMVVYRTTKGGAALVLSLIEKGALAFQISLPAIAAIAACFWGVLAIRLGRGFAELERERGADAPEMLTKPRESA